MSPTPAPGDLFALPMPRGRFAVAQVLAPRGDGVEIAALDRTFDRVPSLDDLRGASVLRQDHHSIHGEPARVCVEAAPPHQAVRVGNLPPVETFPTTATSYGAWELIPTMLELQRHWVEVLTPADRAALRAPGTPVAVDLGSGPLTLSSASWRVFIGPRTAVGFKHPSDAPVRWDALDAVHGLTEVNYAGSDPGLEAFLRRRPTIRAVSWHEHQRGRIDLSHTQLATVSLGAGTEPLEVALPASTAYLNLSGPCAAVAVALADPASAPMLSVFCDGALPPPIAGLATLRSLTARGLVECDLARLAGYPALETLTLQASRGALRNLGALAELAALRALFVDDFYQMDPSAFPARNALPALARVEFRGLLKDHVRALRERLAGVARVEFHSARSAAWAEANLDNPFREWDEASPAFGRAACVAWRAALAAAARLGRGATRSEARVVVRRLIETLNALDAKHQAMDTIRREEAGEALSTLAAKFDAVSDDDVTEWFDEWRDF